MKLEDIIIDDEFASYLPALSNDERKQLMMNMELTTARGEKFADIYVWKGHKVLLDGHHRYEISESVDFDFDLPIVQVDLKDREACLEWMRNKQLGQRNLTKDQRTFYLGEKYNSQKKSHGGERKASAQNEPLKTAERIAKEHNVSPATVKRAGQFAEEVAKDPEKKKAVLSGKPAEKPDPAPKPVTPTDDFLKRAKTRFSQVSEEVSSLSRVLKELGSEDVGRYVNSARLNSAFKEIRAVLKEGVPAVKCSKCSGKGCILCKETGYITQAHLEG